MFQNKNKASFPVQCHFIFVNLSDENVIFVKISKSHLFYFQIVDCWINWSFSPLSPLMVWFHFHSLDLHHSATCFAKYSLLRTVAFALCLSDRCQIFLSPCGSTIQRLHCAPRVFQGWHSSERDEVPKRPLFILDYNFVTFVHGERKWINCHYTISGW